MNINIRRMSIEDVHAVHEIEVQSFTLPWSERSMRYEVVNNSAARCWVAESGNHVVGMLVLWLIIDEVHIATIGTHPNYRRQGIAKSMLSEALKSAYNEGAQSALLEVRAGNEAAIKMYTYFGFEEAGRRKGYYKDNFEDAILMTLKELPFEPFPNIVRNRMNG